MLSKFEEITDQKQFNQLENLAADYLKKLLDELRFYRNIEGLRLRSHYLSEAIKQLILDVENEQSDSHEIALKQAFSLLSEAQHAELFAAVIISSRSDLDHAVLIQDFIKYDLQVECRNAEMQMG